MFSGERNFGDHACSSNYRDKINHKNIPVANDAAEVVLPTPPFPEVIHTILPRDFSPFSTEEGWDRTNECFVELERCRIGFAWTGIGAVITDRFNVSNRRPPTEIVLLCLSKEERRVLRSVIDALAAAMVW